MEKFKFQAKLKINSKAHGTIGLFYDLFLITYVAAGLDEREVLL